MNKTGVNERKELGGVRVKIPYFYPFESYPKFQKILYNGSIKTIMRDFLF